MSARFEQRPTNRLPNSSYCKSANINVEQKYLNVKLRIIYHFALEHLLKANTN
jgi:hypothetical protein